MGLLKFFDAYNLQARIFPALIAGLPTLILLLVSVPWDDFGLPQATASVVGLVLLFAFGDVARRRGKLLEQKLGTGSTPELWHRSDTTIASVTKDRCRDFIAKQLNLPAPTLEEEKQFPQKSNGFYIAAGDWLREHTRDQRRFAILFSENVTYGFRRNLLGLKMVSLSMNVIVLFICIALLHFRPSYSAEIKEFDLKITVVMIAVGLHSVYLLFAIGKGPLREASWTYGRQLVLSCESLMKSNYDATYAASERKGNARS